ncbi:MAG: 2-oxoacid:ferredoxin oxidoreductase subunit beta, partial [Candidatus Aegiribacteria sp.]|nr:2-oxoacid:ferredoxin oxidoreductase subunit beta [Candidatus Aegiribacteria sp.]
ANRLGGPVEMMKLLKENTINISQAKAMKPEDAHGKIVRGVFVDNVSISYEERYDKLCEKAGNLAGASR